MFGFPLSTIGIDEGPALGAALLAGVGAGIYADIEEACSAVVKVARGASVIEANARVYDDYYRLYGGLYPALQATFGQIGALV